MDATIGAVIGYKSGLTGVPLILTGGIFGGVMDGVNAGPGAAGGQAHYRV